MLLDWGHSFKRSLWNKEAVALLCFDFQDKLKGGIYDTVVYDPNIMTLDFIRRALLDKLERPQASFRRNERAGNLQGVDRAVAVEKEVDAQRQTKIQDRRRRRRNTVCFHLHIVVPASHILSDIHSSQSYH